jgi:hypothetical protein
VPLEIPALSCRVSWATLCVVPVCGSVTLSLPSTATSLTNFAAPNVTRVTSPAV